MKAEARPAFLTALICMVSASLAARTITRVEYFLNSDPGIGLGIEVPVSPASTLELFHTIDFAGEPEGFYLLGIRLQDSEGDWGLTTFRSFFVLNKSLIGQPDITTGEYFLDSDPGLGNGTTLNVGGSSSLDSSISFDLSNMADGTHLLFLRLQDDKGNWSHTAFRPFYLDSNDRQAPLKPIVGIEYFLSSDGSVSTTVTYTEFSPSNSVVIDLPVNLSSYDPDTAIRIYLRLIDQSGNKSATYSQEFLALTQFEFWRHTVFTALELENPDLSGLLEDPDADGFPNLLEFAFNLNPQSQDAFVLLTSDNDPGQLSLTYRQRRGGVGTVGVDYVAKGLMYAVEVSDTLQQGSWISGSNFVEMVDQPVDNEDGTETVTVRLKVPYINANRYFMRLMVELL